MNDDPRLPMFDDAMQQVCNTEEEFCFWSRAAEDRHEEARKELKKILEELNERL